MSSARRTAPSVRRHSFQGLSAQPAACRASPEPVLPVTLGPSGGRIAWPYGHPEVRAPDPRCLLAAPGLTGPCSTAHLPLTPLSAALLTPRPPLPSCLTGSLPIAPHGWAMPMVPCPECEVPRYRQKEPKAGAMRTVLLALTGRASAVQGAQAICSTVLAVQVEVRA